MGLRYCEVLDGCFTANLRLIIMAKEFWKSVGLWPGYVKIKCPLFDSVYFIWPFNRKFVVSKQIVYKHFHACKYLKWEWFTEPTSLCISVVFIDVCLLSRYDCCTAVSCVLCLPQSCKCETNWTPVTVDRHTLVRHHWTHRLSTLYSVLTRRLRTDIRTAWTAI